MRPAWMELPPMVRATVEGLVGPEPYAAGDAVTEVLAAHAGFLLAGGLTAEQPSPVAAAQGLAAIAAAKLHLGLGALRWLRRRR